MLILTILLSITLAAGFTFLPARVQHRKPARPGVTIGAGGRHGACLAVGGLHLVPPGPDR